MPAEYHIRFSGDELGPLLFRDLVRLVRDGTLTREDLVRSNWEPEWRAASDVVGLFYMAGRQDVIDQWMLESAKESSRLGSDLQRQDTRTQFLDTDSRAWAGHAVPQSATCRAEEAADVHKQQSFDQILATETLHKQIMIAIEDSLSKQTSEARHVASQAWPMLERNTQVILRYTVLGGSAIGFLSLAVVAILSFSEAELQRYPDAKLLAAGIKMFPGWGTCSLGEFLFLLFDAAMVAGIGGFACAWLLVSKAERLS